MPIPKAMPFPTALPNMRGELAAARIRALRPARCLSPSWTHSLLHRVPRAGSCDDDGAPFMSSGWYSSWSPKANRDACCDSDTCVNEGICTDYDHMLQACCNDEEVAPMTDDLDTVAVEKWYSRQGSLSKPAVEWNLAHLLELEAGACVGISMNEYWNTLNSKYGAACVSKYDATCVWPAVEYVNAYGRYKTAPKAWIKLEVCDSVRLERAPTPRQNLLAAIRTPHTAYHRFASALAAMD